MPDLKDLLAIDLQQRGLQLATKIHEEEFKKLNLDMSVVPRDSVQSVKLAFERVKTFSGIKCPHCWVKYGKESTLIIDEPIRNKVDFYKCKDCDFDHYFSKPII